MSTSSWGGGKARIVFTDPPYMVDYKSQRGISYNAGKFKHHRADVFNDDLDDEEAMNLYTEAAKNAYDYTLNDACIYWWHASKKQHLNRDALMKAGWHMSQIIIWVKDGLILSKGQLFHRAYEPCIVGWKDGNKHFMNRLVADMKDVWSLGTKDFAELADVWYQHRDPTANYVHPTQKPVALATRALKRSTQIGDSVLDLFAGSGSTLMACENNNRICFAMELDPAYCDVIRKRYANSQGKGNQWIKATPVIK